MSLSRLKGAWSNWVSDGTSVADLFRHKAMVVLRTARAQQFQEVAEFHLEATSRQKEEMMFEYQSNLQRFDRVLGRKHPQRRCDGRKRTDQGQGPQRNLSSAGGC